MVFWRIQRTFFAIFSVATHICENSGLWQTVCRLFITFRKTQFFSWKSSFIILRKWRRIVHSGLLANRDCIIWPRVASASSVFPYSMHTLTFRTSSTAYACVGTSPVLFSSSGCRSLVATVTKTSPLCNLVKMILNKASELKSGSSTRIEQRSGIQPVNACRSVFWDRKWN